MSNYNSDSVDLLSARKNTFSTIYCGDKLVRKCTLNSAPASLFCAASKYKHMLIY